MSLLAKAREYPKTVVAVAAIVILGCVFLTWHGQNRTVVDVGDLFYDESSGGYSRHPSQEIPPIAGSAGDSLVRAVLIDESKAPSPENTAYLFRFTPAKKEGLKLAVSANPRASFTEMFLWENEGKEVRLPQPGSTWVNVNTPEGQKIAGLQ